MKIDKYMLILSIVLISLLAISAVSASEDANATDIVETSDVDDVQAIDETLNEDSTDVLSENQADETLAADEPELNITTEDTPYDKDASIDVEVVNPISGVELNNSNVSVYVEGEFLNNITLNELGKGKLIIPAGKYESGTYLVETLYRHNSTILYNNAILSITKAAPTINVEDVNSTYGEIVTIPFNVTDSSGKGISGDVIITIFWEEDSLSKHVKITDGVGKASFNLTDLIGIFSGNSTFNISSLLGGNGTFNISSLLGGNGTLDFGSFFNGTTNITVGNSTFDIGSLMNGTFSLGNSTFDIGSILNGTTNITFGNKTIDFSSLFGNKGNSTDNKPDALGAPVYDNKLTEGSTFDFGSLLNGTSTFDIGSLLNGTFSIGNSSFNISSLLNGTFSIGNSTFDIGSLLNGTTNMSIGNTTLDFSSLLNGTNSSFDISSILNSLLGKGDNTFAYLFDPGTYKFTVSYLVSRNFNETSKDAKLNIIPKENVKFAMAATLPKKYGDKTILEIALADGYSTAIPNATISVAFNGIDQGNITLNENGTYIMTIENLENGTYTLVLSYNGTNATFKFDVEIPVLTSIVAKDMSTSTINVKLDGKTGGYFTVTLKDNSGKVLANKEIQFAFDGKQYTVNTDENGIAKFQINVAKAGTYTIAACFLGDAQFDSSFAVAKVTVKKQKTQLKAKNAKYKTKAKTKKLTATLKNSKGKAIAGKKIKFTVKGKTYTGKTNKKGVATVKVKLKKKGTYKFTAKFAGDDTYNTISKKAKLVLK